MKFKTLSIFINTFSLWEKIKFFLSLFFIFIILNNESLIENLWLYVVSMILLFAYFILVFFDLYTENLERPSFQKSPFERKYTVIYVLTNMIISFFICSIISVFLSLLLFGKIQNLLFFAVVVKIFFEIILKTIQFNELQRFINKVGRNN